MLLMQTTDLRFDLGVYHLAHYSLSVPRSPINHIQEEELRFIVITRILMGRRMHSFQMQLTIEFEFFYLKFLPRELCTYLRAKCRFQC